MGSGASRRGVAWVTAYWSSSNHIGHAPPLQVDIPIPTKDKKGRTDRIDTTVGSQAFRRLAPMIHRRRIVLHAGDITTRHDQSMNYIDLIAVLAIAQLIFFSVLVGRARGVYGVKAPAVSGHEMFERAYRVQMNTLELVVAFLPTLYIAAKYWPQAYVASAGVIYLVGRLIYWRSYVTAPASRGIGFMLSMLPILALLFAALIGIVREGVT